MQPIFCSFASGLPYRKTVKLYFCRISTIYLLVSIYENVSFRLFSSFLTAGNKSKCGTLQRLTDPQQSTVNPIFRPMSPSNRQAMQGKSLSCRRYTLELLPTCENIGLQSHLGSRSSQAQSSAPNLHPRRPPATATPPMRPQALPSHAHSHTPDAPSGPPQPHPRRTPSHTPDSPPDAPLPPHPHSPLTPATHLTCTSPPKFACNSRTGVTQWYKVIQTSKVFRGNCMRNCST